MQSIEVTVPDIPEGRHPADCRRWRLTGLDLQGRGFNMLLGESLFAGDVISAPGGALVVAVDMSTVGWDNHYQTGKRYAVKDATVRVFVVGGQGLIELWSRHFAHVKSAYGQAAVKKMTALLTEHPASQNPVTLVTQKRRPNASEAACRWCGAKILPGQGHLVGVGAEAEVEHWEKCPARWAQGGTPCALCSVGVIPNQASQVHEREGEGRWEVRHHPDLDCINNTMQSFEQMLSEEAAERSRRHAEAKAREQRLAKDRARRAERKAKAEAAERAAHDAEQQRIKGLKVTGTTSSVLYDKSIGDAGRARLIEYTDTLEDATTTRRWTVETYGGSTGWNGEDYDPAPGHSSAHTRLPDARRVYQSLKYETAPRGTHRPTAGGTCDNCGRHGARHDRHDSSGIAGRVCDSCNQDEYFMLSFA